MREPRFQRYLLEPEREQVRQQERHLVLGWAEQQGGNHVPEAGVDQVPSALQDHVPKAHQYHVPEAREERVLGAHQDLVPEARGDRVPEAGELVLEAAQLFRSVPPSLDCSAFQLIDNKCDNTRN